MKDRTKLLVHLRRISSMFDNAFRYGPDGTIEGKSAHEHPAFINYSCAFYLAGCLAFLEGEDGAYSWNSQSTSHTNFDSFVQSHPQPPRDNYISRNISQASMNALAEIKNAVTHNNGDLALNRNKESLAIVTAANIKGVLLSGSVVSLEFDFLEYVRVATLAVRNYHGDS